jgi:uracil-DNA glycosylase
VDAVLDPARILHQAARSIGLPDTDEYNALVAARKACRICVERSPGKIRSCAEFDFDPDVVSHWEPWLGHQRPKLLAVGQDFGNVGYFVRNRGHDEPNNKTNDNLRLLLREAGFDVTIPSEADRSTPVFLTNSILCIKEGPMDGTVRPSWVDACADQHLRPVVRYLRPPVVVGMGSCGWRAVRRVFALDHAPERISHAAGSSWISADCTRVFAVGHPGPQGLTNRPWLRQAADWRRIGEVVAAALAGGGHPP